MDIEPQPCFYKLMSLHTMSTDFLLMTTLATLLNASKCNLWQLHLPRSFKHN